MSLNTIRPGLAALLLFFIPACGSSGSSGGPDHPTAATGGVAAGGAQHAGGAPSMIGGTSSVSSGGGGGVGGNTPSTCTSQAICTSVMLAHVNSLCGTTAASAIPVDQPAPPAQDIDMCLYQSPAGAGQQAVIARYCFPDVATAAQFFTGEHDRGLSAGDGTETDLTGVGDRAFYRANVDQKTTSVYAVKGNVLAMVEVDIVTPGTEASVKQCLLTLTNEVLAS